MKKVYINSFYPPETDLSKIKSELRDKGAIVVDPTVLPSGLSDFDYHHIRSSMCTACDTMLLVPGWEKDETSKKLLKMFLKIDTHIEPLSIILSPEDFEPDVPPKRWDPFSSIGATLNHLAETCKTVFSPTTTPSDSAFQSDEK